MAWHVRSSSYDDLDDEIDSAIDEQHHNLLYFQTPESDDEIDSAIDEQHHNLLYFQTPESDDEIDSAIDEQQHNLLSFQTLESDHDFAFRLQLEEALTASLSSNDAGVVLSPSNRSPSLVRIRVHDEGSSSSASSRNDDNNNKTYPDRFGVTGYAVHSEGSLSSSSSRNGENKASPVRIRVLSEDLVYRVYCKGVVSEEWDSREGKLKSVLGIGVAICDWKDELVSEVKKKMVNVEKNRVISEFRALIEGLTAAGALGLTQIRFFCDYYPLFQYVTGRWQPRQRKIESLVNQMTLLRRKFKNCFPGLVARNDLKFAFKIARDALVQEVASGASTSTSSISGSIVRTSVDSGKNLERKEKCVICLEDTDVAQMFSVDGCLHRYCFSCMRQHIEVKLLHGIEPKCPHEDCKSDLTLSSCSKFLTPNLIELMKQRMKEASIPPSEKIYCPYPRCSALMSKTEVSKYAKATFCGDQRSGARKCLKCHGIFCINCNVPWHSNMTCSDYKMSHPNPPIEDVKLKSLATKNMWRQCIKCNHMIELSQGCYHMTCRCGNEFCYNCGAEWKDKRATCSCPLWDEGHLLESSNTDYDDEFDEDTEEEDYSDEEYYYNPDVGTYFID